MAARRLLILMLVLLGLSTLAAALMDPGRLEQDRPGSAEGTETTAANAGAETSAKPEGADNAKATAGARDREEARAAEGPGGKRLGASIVIGREVKVVPIRVGDQLALRVKWDRPGLVEIPALGLLEPVAPGAPARFDVLGTDAVSYGVRLLDPGRLVARIEVTARGRDASAEAKPGSQRER
jgi:hypothetical protein